MINFLEVTVNVQLIQQYMKVWEPFRDMWEVDKDLFIERYELENPTVAVFDANIGRYTEVANNVQIIEAVTAVHFMVINSGELKVEIINHCIEWQRRLCMLLYSLTEQNIFEVHNYIKENGER